MKRKIIVTLYVLAAVLFTGCNKSNGGGLENEPETLMGNEPRPTWTMPSGHDYTSSMTAVVKIDLTKMYPNRAKDFVANENDLLAAFIGDQCISKAKQVDSLYYLFVAGSEGTVTLWFYSGYYKNLFAAKDAFVYKNDAMLGTVKDPFIPTFFLDK